MATISLLGRLAQMRHVTTQIIIMSKFRIANTFISFKSSYARPIFKDENDLSKIAFTFVSHWNIYKLVWSTCIYTKSLYGCGCKKYLECGTKTSPVPIQTFSFSPFTCGSNLISIFFFIFSKKYIYIY